MLRDPVATATGKGLAELPVGGVSLFSTVDWPDHIVATVFLKGCPWRCVYCHNKHLLTSSPSLDDIAWGDVAAQLERRRGFLDGVVFTGGEPTATQALSQLIAQVREMGFAVGLHTNGTHPERLAELLGEEQGGEKMVDWVGLDIKAPFSRYEEITGVAGSGERARESLSALQTAGVAHEVRTTLYPQVFGEDTLVSLGEDLARVGERRWMLQRCRSEDLTHDLPLSFDLRSVVESKLKPLFDEVIIR